MRIKIIRAAFLFLFCSFNVYGQTFELLEKEAANVFLMNNNISAAERVGSVSGLENLKSILFPAIGSSKDIEELRNDFSQFEKVSKNISVDSALFLFNQWYLELSNAFYDYHKDKFFSSNKTKILLFSTSMSCYCTLEMCKNQAIDVINFVRENNDEYDYWIVDSYEHNELRIKYETYFTPAVLIFNERNELLFKIEYDEKMVKKLKGFLNK